MPTTDPNQALRSTYENSIVIVSGINQRLLQVVGIIIGPGARVIRVSVAGPA